MKKYYIVERGNGSYYLDFRSDEQVRLMEEYIQRCLYKGYFHISQASSNIINKAEFNFALEN